MGVLPAADRGMPNGGSCQQSCQQARRTCDWKVEHRRAGGRRWRHLGRWTRANLEAQRGSNEQAHLLQHREGWREGGREGGLIGNWVLPPYSLSALPPLPLNELSH